MWGLHRWLGSACAVLLAAGAVGVATRSRSGLSATADPTVTLRHAPAGGPATSVPTASVPDSSVLSAAMINPKDMGGYYRVDPSQATAISNSAPCLAGLQPSNRQAGRADTALLGPDLHSVPTIVEIAASYTAGTAEAVYRDVVAAVGACPSFGFSFGGSGVSATLVAGTIPPVGVADQVWSGTFTYAGASLSLQLGVVLDGQTVVTLMWLDSVPPAAAIMGGFTSTLSAALGKLA